MFLGWVLALVLVFAALAAILFCRIRFRIRVEASEGGVRYLVWVKPPLIPRYFRVADPDALWRKFGALGGRNRKRRDKHPLGAPRFPRHLVVDECSLSIEIGAGDASGTALLWGALRGIVGCAIPFLRRLGVRFRRKPVVRLVPCFDSVVLRGVLQAQFSFQVYKFVGGARV